MSEGYNSDVDGTPYIPSDDEPCPEEPPSSFSYAPVPFVPNASTSKAPKYRPSGAPRAARQPNDSPPLHCPTCPGKSFKLKFLLDRHLREEDATAQSQKLLKLSPHTPILAKEYHGLVVAAKHANWWDEDMIYAIDTSNRHRTPLPFDKSAILREAATRHMDAFTCKLCNTVFNRKDSAHRHKVRPNACAKSRGEAITGPQTAMLEVPAMQSGVVEGRTEVASGEPSNPSKRPRLLSRDDEDYDAE